MILQFYTINFQFSNHDYLIRTYQIIIVNYRNLKLSNETIKITSEMYFSLFQWYIPVSALIILIIFLNTGKKK